MKKFILTLTLLLATLMLAQSQPPQALKYKAVAKDEWGVALPTKEVTLRFTILLGSETGNEVYQELHYTTTNKFGLMDVNIGQGNPIFGYFDEIDWGAGSYFMKVELDTKGGLDFRHEGASQLLSVPYALYAGKAKVADGSIIVDFNNIINKPDFTNWDQDVTDDFDWDYNSLMNKPDLLNYVEYPATQLWDKDASDDFSGSWNDISDIPPGFADNIDDNTQLTAEQVDEIVSDNGYLLFEEDADPTNELQVLSISHDTIFLSEGGFVKLPAAEVLTGVIYYGDQDGDGFGDQYKALWVPYYGTAPEGYVVESGDCDDGQHDVSPGTVEICGDGIDQDCDGVDLECPPEDIDDDNDGFTENQGDCDDTDSDIYPGAVEWCDGKDNDCNGQIDDNCQCEQGYANCDGDPANGCETNIESNTQNCGACGIACPEGYICQSGTCVQIFFDEDQDGFLSDVDCNDFDNTVYPGAPEICGDGIDQDCDGADQECDPLEVDNDLDGYTELQGDCDDTNPAVHPGAIDLPDNAFVDANCDGIDGDLSASIFVAIVGNDANPGTIEQPVRTISEAINIAVSQGKSSVLVSMGTYNERVTLVNGISIYGGYDYINWQRSTSNEVIITGTDDNTKVMGIYASNITSETILANISIATINATGTYNNQGKSNYGIVLDNSTQLVINNCIIHVGSASNGIAGVEGIRGSDGGNGQDGEAGDCDNELFNTRAEGGTSPCDCEGGYGGLGRYAQPGESGGRGFRDNYPSGGYGGQGGALEEPGSIGLPGGLGTKGQDGFGGNGGIVNGLWIGADGSNGSTGDNGAGGGGGGAGGGQSGTWVLDGTGNGGGGGGAGGCGGSGGTGGYAGGGSFGIFSTNSTLSIVNSDITSNSGGNGGAGGAGGIPGEGGSGGNGASECTDEVGAGGNGGPGGRGGLGGHGGGGAGGPSVGILLHNSTISGNTSNIIQPGSGGAGGNSPGNNGQTGSSVDILEI